jgi:hypothetical protein
MEFTITCPIDGQITVSLEDVDTVVLREAERADITFVCPTCGTEIPVSAVVPSFLMAAIEALAEDDDSAGGAFAGMFETTAKPIETCDIVPVSGGFRHRVVLRVLPATAGRHLRCRGRSRRDRRYQVAALARRRRTRPL